MYIPKIKILSQHRKIIKLPPNVDFLDFYLQNYSSATYSSLLLSGGSHDLSQYSIAGIDPYFVINAKREDIWCIHNNKEYRFHYNPFNYLKNLFNTTHIKDNIDKSLPITCGCIGYFGYEQKNILECLPQTAVDDLNLPDMYLVFYRTFLLYNLSTKELVCIENEGSGLSKIDISPNFEQEPCNLKKSNHISTLRLNSNFTHEEYIKAICHVIEYIKAGEIYQANLSQRFQIKAPQIKAQQLFKNLFYLNPAPFFAYLNAGNFKILSSSPERFLYLSGNTLETRPIKGTRPRMKSKEKDDKIKNELSVSIKDDAELSMIVDLLRNDLGRICEVGSVYVDAHKRIEAYTNVYHLVSIIKGRLSPEKNPIDIICACFPGGSITGCPKIRSMEIIDELEPNARSVYCGSIGYISFHRTMDLNIAIRTLIYRAGTYYFNVGGGIVYNSDPEAEFQETIHKGKSIISALKMTKECM